MHTADVFTREQQTLGDCTPELLQLCILLHYIVKQGTQNVGFQPNLSKHNKYTEHHLIPPAHSINFWFAALQEVQACAYHLYPNSHKSKLDTLRAATKQIECLLNVTDDQSCM